MRSARDVPPIGWIIIGLATVLLVSLVSVVVLHVRDDRDLERRVIAADSTAHVYLMEAVILNRDAKAANTRADSAERDAHRADHVADSVRRDLATLGTRAAASSAKVDRSTLAPDVAQALTDADAFRLAVTPTLAADSIDVATWKATAERYAHAYELQSQAYAAQGASVVALETENRALKRQHAPRCGWKCGAVIGASVAVVALGGITYLVVAAAAP